MQSLKVASESEKIKIREALALSMPETPSTEANMDKDEYALFNLLIQEVTKDINQEMQDDWKLLKEIRAEKIALHKARQQRLKLSTHPTAVVSPLSNPHI